MHKPRPDALTVESIEPTMVPPRMRAAVRSHAAGRPVAFRRAEGDCTPRRPVE